jgi:hypothetical protein
MCNRQTLRRASGVKRPVLARLFAGALANDIGFLRMVIAGEHLHGCDATGLDSVSVRVSHICSVVHWRQLFEKLSRPAAPYGLYSCKLSIRLAPAMLQD